MENKIKNASYHPLSEKILNIIEKQTNNTSHNYFRIVIGFFMAQIASNMRCKVKGAVTGAVPVNMYACTLMPSGGGKGHSLRILESQVINKFKEEFINCTLPVLLENNLDVLAQKKSILTGLPMDKCKGELVKESLEYGPLPYAFDSGTGPAFKQVRSKAQLCNAGALSFICDEIGSNLINNKEITSIGLEVFDNGELKPKITKNSEGNKRTEDRPDPVPTNMLWFGTPAKLFNSGAEEDNFYSLLQEGYARRNFFGEGNRDATTKLTGKELRDSLLACNFEQELEDISNKLGDLAGIQYHNRVITVDAPEEELLLDYRIWCEQRANELPSHDDIRRTELTHRYWKAYKLAGAYAFVDGNSSLTKENLLSAFKLVEDSGESLNKILKREKAYVKLAKYLGEINKPMTHADLSDELPFFKGSASVRQDMINLASAWGYQNGIVIKSFEQGKISFLEGQRLEGTNLNEIIISVSQDKTYNYDNQTIPWSKIDKLGSISGIQWCTHHFMSDPMHTENGNHRHQKYSIPAFNLLVLDIDGGCAIDTARDILKQYTYFMYTTKRHTNASHRFRIVLPMKYKLFLNPKEYNKFMANIFTAFPFEGMDEQTKDIARTWATNAGTIYKNEGELFDPRPYIPDTTLEREEKERIKKDYGNMNHITRWFLEKAKEGNRNNTLFRYGALLKDKGMSQDEIEKAIIDLNSKLDCPLDLTELTNTVFASISVR